jgi:ectoine hydroxylase-related dioxygenase (phytanoyl-CoA dioxygenase family)
LIDDSDVAAYDRDGVVCLRGRFDSRWIERLRGAIERDIVSPGPSATNFAEGSSAGTFFGDMFMWRRDADFRAAALESPAPAIAARLMGSKTADFFYDQLFVKEPSTAHPTPWHQDQPYWPVKGWQIASVWIALDKVDRSNGAVEFVAGSHRWGINYRPTPFRKGHEVKFTSSDLAAIPDIDSERSKYDIRWWEMASGDCLVFHAMIVHGAPGNSTPGAPGVASRCATLATTCAMTRGPARSSFRTRLIWRPALRCAANSSRGSGRAPARRRE